MKKKVIKVAELFAGVGGFRIGLEGWNGKSSISKYEEPIHGNFEVVWSNQYEPSTPKIQIASWVYESKFKSGNHSNKNIEEVEISDIDKHKIDVLVGGFPCQDYSVASLLKNSKGLIGKKGVLWWQIHRILDELKKKPDYLILENVDRLVNSPVKQRGRDFAIMLASLNDLGYAVEWRIINAADYGFPQKRKRIFIVGYMKGSKLFKNILGKQNNSINIENTLLHEAFPVNKIDMSKVKKQKINGTLEYISKTFNIDEGKSPFLNSGICWNREFLTIKIKVEERENLNPLKTILQKGAISKEFFVDKKIVIDDKKGWAYHKGSKKVERVDKITGHKYQWSEGKMSLTENLEYPARTIITSEGGAGPSRSRHLINVIVKGESLFRRLTPLELERANMFPDNHTQFYLNVNKEQVEVPPIKRAFLMGNALVIGVVEKIGCVLINRIS